MTALHLSLKNFSARSSRYSPAPINRWAAFVKKQAPRWREVFVYFKHEETGTGPVFAKQFLKGAVL